ncbi:trypsin-like peptidase domain-containing protein [[Clostridium] spiroforme]|nr:trypsin-like peptidase domain-containing protein [Thomasclavelia spiroformis]MBM6880113.1 trypsin-like peptidase domain-containing protein [Thomasclavelia spiroformis]MBM6931532.1 trypsin-like peptidase domain-containing protein [Thomasclavelia spiroformis]
MKEKLKPILKIAVIAAIVLSFAANGYVLYKVIQNDGDTTLSSTRNAKVEEVDYDVKTETTSVVDAVSDSIVGVVVYSNNTTSSLFGRQTENETPQQSGSGSGVVYEQTGKYTYIITNHHVIDGADKVQVVFSNNEYVDAEIVGSDEYSDVAILKCQPDFDVTVINIGDSSLLDKGETVLAIGSPLGIEYSGTVTQGIVSGTDRTVSVDLNSDGVDDWDMNVIQTDAAINPGNSGGALVNMKGELVGITNMKFAEETVEGMGFAIPVNDVISVAKQIRLNGKVSYPVIGISGVSLADYSAYQLQRYGVNVAVNTGLYVVEATNNGPAQKAGIQSGDVIVKVENTEITTYKSFLTELYSHKPGDTIEVTINRSGTEKTVQVTLEEK